MRRGKMTEEQALTKYTPMLHKLAWSFHNSTGLEREDLFSEACVGFLRAYRTWDPKKGELGLRLWVVVTNHLRTYVQSQKAKPLPVYEFAEDIFEDPRQDAENTEDFADLVSRMSQEAQTLVQAIVSSPGDFMRSSSRATRGALTQMLRQQGWPVEKIARCYREVKLVLNS